jgi:hypothetical protein
MKRRDYKKPDKMRIRWLKFIAKNGYYDKSVKRTILIGHGEWYQFQKCVVYEISLERVKITGRDAFEMLGYNPGDNPLRLSAYLRLRTDSEYYPPHGVCGIPSEKSRFYIYFQKSMESGWEKNCQRLRKIEDEKIKEAMLLRRIEVATKRAESISKSLSNLKHQREKANARFGIICHRSKSGAPRKRPKSTQFFQMLAGAQAISDYATKQNKQ